MNGHYVSYIKLPNNENIQNIGGQWYCCNEDNVEVIEEKNIPNDMVQLAVFRNKSSLSALDNLRINYLPAENELWYMQHAKIFIEVLCMMIDYKIPQTYTVSLNPSDIYSPCISLVCNDDNLLVIFIYLFLLICDQKGL